MLSFGRCFTLVLALAIWSSTPASPPPWPDRPDFENIQVGSQGECFAMVMFNGVYRRHGNGPWVQVIADPLATYGQVFERGDSSLMLTSFDGGPIYRSHDRGQHWQTEGVSQPPPGWLENREYNNTRAITPTGVAFALTGADLRYSEDGGKTWQITALPLQGAAPSLYRQAVAADDRVVYFLGERTLWRSTDRGQHWQSVPQEAPAISPISQHAGGEPRSLRLMADGRLFALGSPAADQPVFVSTDGGANWERQRFGVPSDTALVWRSLAGVWRDVYDGLEVFYISERGVIPGRDGIFKKVHRIAADGTVSEIDFPGSQIIRLVEGAGGVLYLTSFGPDAFESSDGGKTWRVVTRDGMDGP